MTEYYIFKLDHITRKTTIVCTGIHNTPEECRLHWQAYMYGAMDSALEIFGSRHMFSFGAGVRELSFRIWFGEKKDVEYFMLTDGEGAKLVQEISKNAN